MFAVVQSGGKQYRVEKGDIVRVEKLDVEPGAVVELPVVLLSGKSTKIGSPQVSGASVRAEVLSHGRGPKLQVRKYKAKINYRRVLGHRQAYTELRVKEIAGAG